MWMGWVTFTDRTGDVVEVDKSFGYRRAGDGSLKLVLHHYRSPAAQPPRPAIMPIDPAGPDVGNRRARRAAASPSATPSRRRSVGGVGSYG